MSIFTEQTNDSPLTDYQRERLRWLLSTKEVPWRAEGLVRKLGTVGINRDEAAVLIDRMAGAPRLPTRADLAARALRDHLWGRLRKPCDRSCADGDRWPACGRPHLEHEPEAVVAQRWDNVLGEHFHIQQEVRGRHWSGKSLRIDRVLWPKFNWGSGRRTPVGFEIKAAGGTKHDARQACDYANAKWDLDPPLGVFDTEVPPSQMLLIGLHRDDPNQSRVLEPLGAFALIVRPGRAPGGPADHADPFVGLYFNGHLMWATRQGMANANKWAPIRKVGSA